MKTTGSQRAHWRWSLATKLAAAWAISLGGAVGISSWVTHRDAGRRLLTGLRQGIQQDAGEIRLKLGAWAQAFEEDARSCSQSPLVFEFLEKRDTPEEERWRQLLEDEFRSVFAGKPAYFQMRLLSAGGPGDGREILRLDRKDGSLVVTPPDRLQSKAGMSYFQEALALDPGEIYFSEINLNRDFGRITEPHIPTIRAAVKIGNQVKGEAILIINADMRTVFDEARALASPGTSIRLFDSGDNYLLHPVPGASFATDLGAGLRPADEYPELATGLDSPNGDRWLRDGGSGTGLAFGSQVELMRSPRRAITLITTLPREVWHPELKRSQQRAIWATVLAALAGAGAALLVSLPFAGRLRHLSSALRQFDASEIPDPLPEAGKDEVGTAIERFREMAIKVREQVESLQASRREAEEANAAKEAFLAVMSHEIRTPMNAVVGLIRALEANHPPAHQQPILKSLKSSTSNLMTLLNTALDYTRLREGAIQYTSEIFDAAELVREIGQSFKPTAMAKRLEFPIASVGSLTVRGDPVRFRQVVNNLVSNAIKFTEQGFVGISLRHGDGLLECAVSDSGPGIKPEDLANVFEPFTSLPTGGCHIEAGAGLGLAISRQLVEQQGGQLSVENHASGGVTFTARLPYPEATSAASPEATGGANHTPLRGGLRILYVEDVASNQQVMALTLEGTGSLLVCADTGCQALHLIGQQTPDLILVDLQLPDMAGYELAEQILASHPDLPVIAVTAQSSQQVADRCLQAGMRAVVLKPYSAEVLFRAIAEHATNVFADALMALHPGDQVRSRELATTMAGELRAASRDLANLQATSDPAASTREIKRVRHKLTTALARFQLDTLAATLEQLAESDGYDPTLLPRAIGLLEAAADSLEQWGQAGAPSPM